MLVAVTTYGWRCAAIKPRSSEIDWSATGAMLGGIGAIAAAIGSVALIVLTWRYVRINAALLRLNRDSLDALQSSVATNREMATTMRAQLAVSIQEVNSRLQQEHEPFRHLIDRMMAGLQRLDSVDLIPALNLPDPDRPDKSWVVVPDYFEKLRRAKDLDGTLHSMLERLMDPSTGELYGLQMTLGRCINSARAQTTSDETHSIITELKTNIDAARLRLREILEYLTQRELAHHGAVRRTGSDGDT